MNYLGHAFLSFGDGSVLTGNMIGDHVKGKLALEKFPPGIRKGLELHRKIDVKADNHPATARAKVLFRADYGLYSGPLTDTLFDHFLANDPALFPSAEVLLAFTENTYRQLEEHSAWFPPEFATYFPSMKTHNWLYHYRSLKGVERSLSGLARRARHMPPVDKAYETFIANYYQLNQCYSELIEDMTGYVKIEAGS
jgi:acyl carrier protein phosphodiesterase